MGGEQSEEIGGLAVISIYSSDRVCGAPPAGDAALEQLREEKEFAEGQVRTSNCP